MKLNKIIIALGVVSLVLGVVSRILLRPIPPVDIEAAALVQFAAACFLLSISLSLTKCNK